MCAWVPFLKKGQVFFMKQILRHELETLKEREEEKRVEKNTVITPLARKLASKSQASDKRAASKRQATSRLDRLL